MIEKILPDKHSDLSLSLLNIAGIIIETLKNNQIVEYNELLEFVQENTSKKARAVFPYALSFLFVTGKLSYVPSLDSLRISDEN